MIKIQCTKAEENAIYGLFVDFCPFPDEIVEKRCGQYDECTLCIEDNVKFERTYIDKEYEILDYRARLLQVELKALGMSSENTQRVLNGKSLAYVEKDFLSLIDEYEINNNNS